MDYKEHDVLSFLVVLDHEKLGTKASSLKCQSVQKVVLSRALFMSVKCITLMN